MTPVILLLAAGASSRMQGRDKLLEEVDGAPLLRRQAQAALDTGFAVRVVLPCPGTARRATLKGLGVEIIDVPDAALGMSASIRAVLRGLGPEVTHLILLPADMPDIGTAEIQSLTRAAEGRADTVHRGASVGSAVPGHPVLLPARLFPKLEGLTGDDGAKAALATEHVVQVPLPGRAAITDLDTPEAWAAWRAAR